MNRRPDALTVPTAAVGSDAHGNFVYIITDNRITRLGVTTGLSDNGRIEVTAGLSDETPVVASTKGAVREVVGIGRGAFSGNMRVSFQAARSIG